MQETTLNTPNLPTEAQFETWISSLPTQVAEVVRTHSPFHPHRLKSTGQTVFISRFQEGEGEAPVTLSVVAPQAANPQQASDLTFEGVTPDELYTLAS